MRTDWHQQGNTHPLQLLSHLLFHLHFSPSSSWSLSRRTLQRPYTSLFALRIPYCHRSQQGSSAILRVSTSFPLWRARLLFINAIPVDIYIYTNLYVRLLKTNKVNHIIFPINPLLFVSWFLSTTLHLSTILPSPSLLPLCISLTTQAQVSITAQQDYHRNSLSPLSLFQVSLHSCQINFRST